MFLPIAVGALAVGALLRSPRSEGYYGRGSNRMLPVRRLPGSIVTMAGCPRGYRQVGTITVLGADGVAYQGSICEAVTYAELQGTYR